MRLIFGKVVPPLLGMKQMLKNFQKKILENLNRK